MSQINDKPILKLSPFAEHVILCDLRLFGTVNEPLMPSKLINQIVLNFCEVSDTVRRTSESVTEEELKSLFERMHITLKKSDLIKFRSSSRISVEKYPYPSDPKNMRITLNQNALDKLEIYMKDDSYAALQHIYSRGDIFSAAVFISALVEEYAELPMYRREAIFYADYMNKAAEAIRRNNDGDTCYLIIDTKKVPKIKMYPVEIRLDEWSTYNYIIGIGVFDQTKGEMPISIRISNIQKIDIVTSDKMLVFHNSKKIKELYERITSRGVMFLGSPCNEGETIRIRLTRNGFNLYNSVIFMRPRYDDIEYLANGEYILSFSCTQTQILNYFRKMGSDAEVLEPQELRKKFSDFFIEGSKRYE